MIQAQCSRTRLEFKVPNRIILRAANINAVAPDWNLKEMKEIYAAVDLSNAVAPDWNLKITLNLDECRKAFNAVAPDWNLKQHGWLNP